MFVQRLLNSLRFRLKHDRITNMEMNKLCVYINLKQAHSMLLNGFISKKWQSMLYDRKISQLY